MMRSGVRLKTPPPKTETPKTVYTRKTKHKRRFRNDSSFFMRFRAIMRKTVLNYRLNPSPKAGSIREANALFEGTKR